MIFALVLGVLVGGAAALLLQQWITAALSEPTRTIRPHAAFIDRGRSHRRAA